MMYKMIENSIILIIVFDLLYNDFKIISILFSYMDNKNLEKIQLIITFIKVADLLKLITGVIRNLAIMVKKKKLLK